MKVLAINGSARKNGNTAILIQQVLDVLQEEGFETEMIQLSEHKIERCRTCWACSGQKNCFHKNDDVYEIF